ncbi:hypothetical protein MMC10_010544 [Thelotrema lepadinum]|nr:hypothetical protein [Thelotrema lepadinum]
MHLLFLLTSFLPYLALTTPILPRDPTPVIPDGLALVARQTPTPLASYTPGTFTVPASTSPFFTASNTNAQYYFQTDGNFVVYTVDPQSGTKTAVYSSGTAGHGCAVGDTGSCQLTFGSDGFLSIYVGGSRIWSTGSGYNYSPQYAGVQLQFWGGQIGGTIIQYADIKDAAGQYVWATGPLNCPPPNLLGC